MRKVEVYRADNGELDADPMRAKAHDIAAAFATMRAMEPGDLKSRVDWHVAMEILRHPDLMIVNIQDYINIRDEIASQKKENDNGNND